MSKKVFYTESSEIKEVAEKLRAKYINVVGYVDLDKIFFAFKGGDNDDFQYEVLGLKNEWVKYTSDSFGDVKSYCIAMSYDYYQKISGPLLEWIILECLYSCGVNMDGKLRRKDVHEFSRFLATVEDLGKSYSWRSNMDLPPLLGDETIVFALGDSEE